MQMELGDLNWVPIHLTCIATELWQHSRFVRVIRPQTGHANSFLSRSNFDGWSPQGPIWFWRQSPPGGPTDHLRLVPQVPTRPPYIHIPAPPPTRCVSIGLSGNRRSNKICVHGPDQAHVLPFEPERPTPCDLGRAGQSGNRKESLRRENLWTGNRGEIQCN